MRAGALVGAGKQELKLCHIINKTNSVVAGGDLEWLRGSACLLIVLFKLDKQDEQVSCNLCCCCSFYAGFRRRRAWAPEIDWGIGRKQAKEVITHKNNTSRRQCYSRNSKSMSRRVIWDQYALMSTQRSGCQEHTKSTHSGAGL